MPYWTWGDLTHHPPHPTHAFPCIPTHIPQCLSCNFTPPHMAHPPHITSPTHPHIPTHPCTYPPPHPPHPCLPMHPYTYPPMFVMLLHTTHPTPPMPSHTCLHISPPMFVMLLHTNHPTPPRPTHPTPQQQPMPSHASLPYPTLKYFKV